MGTAFLTNPLISTAIAVGAIVIPIFLAARSAAQFVGANHAYVRRFLTATLFGISLGILGYEFDKLLEFRVTGAISSGLSIVLPQYTYGAVIGLSLFFIALSSPFVREKEKLDVRLLLGINAVLGAINGMIQFAISSAFAVSAFGWFGGKVPLPLLIVMCLLGAIVGAAATFSANVTMASWLSKINKDDAEKTADGENASDTFGCIYSISTLIAGIVYLPFFIILFKFLGLGGLLAYIGVSIGLSLVLVALSAVIEILPTWVLVVAAVIIVVAFQVIRGYGSILTIFH